MTPLQAGVLLFLCRHTEARVTDTAAALGMRLSTLSGVLTTLARKRWVTKRRSVTDRRAFCLRLESAGPALALQSEQRVRHVVATLTELTYCWRMRTAVA